MGPLDEWMGLQVKVEEMKEVLMIVSNKFTYKEFYLLGLAFIAFGLVISPIQEVLQGLVAIIQSPSNLLSDYMVIGGIGASFVNVGLMILLSVIWAYWAKAKLNGALMAAIWMVAGFSFFGKNLFNSIPLMLGVYLYCQHRHIPLADYMHIVCFVTGISPIVSVLTFGMGYPVGLGLLLGILAGVLIGYIIIPMASSLSKVHGGYSLYNVGFALGIIAITVAGIIRVFGQEIPVIATAYQGDDSYAILFLLVLSLGLMLFGLIKNKGLQGYHRIYQLSGKGTEDFTTKANKYLVAFNVGVLGLISVLFVKLCGGTINGPISGGVLSVMGFGFYGKHPKNVLPIMIGVHFSGLINKYEPSGTPNLLTVLLSTTIAPIAGEYGLLPGIFAGFIHKAVATNIGLSHGGISLYNHGLAGGLVAATLVPLFDHFLGHPSLNFWKRPAD